VVAVSFLRKIRSRLESRVTSHLGKGAGHPALCARCARTRGEQGFTLIELVIVLVILPIIIGGVSMAVITSLKDSSGLQNRIGDSADAQITSAYYIRDVQSATYLTTTETPSTAPAVCASGAASGSNSRLLLALYWPGMTPTMLTTALAAGQSGVTSLAVTSLSAAITNGELITIGSGPTIQMVTAAATAAIGATSISVNSFSSTDAEPVGSAVSTITVTSYWLVGMTPSVGQATYRLVRSFCPNVSASSVPIAPSETSALALDPSGTPQTASVTCATTVETCAYASGWISTAGISSVALAVFESGSAYQFNLSAAPRSWSSLIGGLSLGGSAYPPLTLLGPSPITNCQNAGTVLNMSRSGNATITIYGDVGVNSCANNAIDMSNSSNATITDSGGNIYSYGCSASCNVVKTSGASSPSYPPPENTSLPYSAPSVNAPNTAGLPTAPPCAKSGSTYTCQPGKYSSGAFSFLQSSSNVTVDFTGPATSDSACPYCYEFQGMLSANGSSNATLDFTSNTGNEQDFVFDNGLTDNGASKTTFTGSGVFFYIENGPFDQTGSGNDTVNLTSPTSGPYAGIVLFQNVSDTDSMAITASSAATDNYGGEIEVPGAGVSIAGSGTAKLTVTSLIVQTLSLASGSSPNVTIG
jgi:prepilin-type N-terminal cleavage/methylation domain-containing protein